MFIHTSLTDDAVRWVLTVLSLLPKVFAVGVLGTIASVVINYYRKQSNGQ